MQNGNKVNCIFGFCDILQFAELTQGLKRDILEFTNYIAEIVHQEIDRHSGSINKNLGESFLVIWKFGSELEESTVTFDSQGQEIIERGIKKDAAKSGMLTCIAEQAILSFI